MHLKKCVKDIACLKKFIDITNASIKLGHWSLYFKVSTTIIIFKLNKKSYDTLKNFCSIILLNTIRKIFKNVIGERLQFQAISNNFIHQCQLGGLKQCFSIDTDVTLTYVIQLGWARNLTTNTLAFDITYFFSLLNHQVLPVILLKVSFDSKISIFFQDYLIRRKTSYFWNNFSSPIFNFFFSYL